MKDKQNNRRKENMMNTQYEEAILIQLAKFLKDEKLLAPEEQLRFLREVRKGRG